MIIKLLCILYVVHLFVLSQLVTLAFYQTLFVNIPSELRIILILTYSFYLFILAFVNPTSTVFLLGIMCVLFFLAFTLAFIFDERPVLIKI
jgi:hypothetical protein